MDNIGALSSDLKLSSDELKRLKKAFDDPEFRKLFKEYADEISNPENRKKYEEEITRMELDRGMDVKFVNPEPCYCLKTRHWPDVSTTDPQQVMDTTAGPGDHKNSKVFINVCKSEVVACPEMKPVNKRGVSMTKSTVHSKPGTGGHGWFWSVPHCFTPPHEEFDKQNNKVMVYDVAFHPKAFDLAAKTAAMRRLVTVTAVDGVQRQYNLRFGKNFQQAKRLAELTASIGASSQDCQPSSGNTPTAEIADIRDDLLLACVHTLKGVAYKGSSRPAVIRNRCDDYANRVSEAQRREAEVLSSCETESQREAIQKLSAFANVRAGDEQQREISSSVPRADDNSGLQSGDQGKSPKPVTDRVQTPVYSVTHSSDFDMLNCRDTADVNPLKRPDRLCIAISLPGISSTNSLDLQVTSSHLSLHSERPVAYKLDLELPHSVDDSKGSAEFNKQTSQLRITLPVLPCPLTDTSADSKAGDPQGQQQPTTTVAASPPIGTEESADGKSDEDGEGIGKSAAQRKRRPNKRRRRRNRTASAPTTGTESESSCPSSTGSGGPTSAPRTGVEDKSPSRSEEEEGKKTKDSEEAGQQQQQPDFEDHLYVVSGTTKSPRSQGDHRTTGLSTVWQQPPDAKENPHVLLVAQHQQQQQQRASAAVPTTDVTDCPIPVVQVPISLLTVAKDRRLAPVRFRQDPYSLTVLLDVRGILPDTLKIGWSAVDTSQQQQVQLMGDNSRESVPAPPALLMLITFASRGSGGCTMDWGVVFCCPSLPPTAIDEEMFCRKAFSSGLSAPEGGTASTESPADFGRRPRVVSCRLSPSNAVLVLAKPDCPVGETKAGQQSLGMPKAVVLAETAVWWSSVATGRTLTAGMQDCPFIGMSEVYGPPVDTRCEVSSPTGFSHPTSDQLMPVPPTAGARQLRVSHLSAEYCQVDWKVNAGQGTGLCVEPIPASMDTCMPASSVDASGTPPVVPVEPTVTAVATTAAAAAVGNQQPPRGILKQRSFSESSGDEQVHLCLCQRDRQPGRYCHSSVPLSSSLEGSTLRMAGVAGSTVSPFLSTDEFPTDDSSASSGEKADEAEGDGLGLRPDRDGRSSTDCPAAAAARTSSRRRWFSTSKLPSGPVSGLDVDHGGADDAVGGGGGTGTAVAPRTRSKPGRLFAGCARQRRRSVNFSQHDQKLDYSPKDTVEALHFTLLHRQRKVRRREARRNCSNSGGCGKASQPAKAIANPSPAGDEPRRCQALQPIDREANSAAITETTDSQAGTAENGIADSVVAANALLSSLPDSFVQGPGERASAMEGPAVGVEEASPVGSLRSEDKGGAGCDVGCRDVPGELMLAARRVGKPGSRMPVLLTSDVILELDT